MKQYIRREFNSEGEMTYEGYFKDTKMIKHHRLDGPALRYVDIDGDMNEVWYVNGVKHREDGPAVISICGNTGEIINMYSEYWLVGNSMNKNMWKQAVAWLSVEKTPAPVATDSKTTRLDGKTVIIDGLEYNLQLVVK